MEAWDVSKISFQYRLKMSVKPGTVKGERSSRVRVYG